MTDADRSRWMMFITVAVLTVCGGGSARLIGKPFEAQT